MPQYDMKCDKCARKLKACLVERVVSVGDSTTLREPCKCGCSHGTRLQSIHQTADMSVAWGQECRGDGGRYAT